MTLVETFGIACGFILGIFIIKHLNRFIHKK